MKILIADDDSVSRRLLQRYLQKWGYEVSAVEDGRQALQQFEGGLFRMVITDWMMPGLDGPSLLRRIRSCRRPGYIYAILVTAKSQKQDLIEGMEAGADDFLTKPVDRDELRVRLRAGERIIRLEHGLRETQAALVQTEQLASLGRLAAGLAHEINNPISYVISNLSILRRDYQSIVDLLDRYGTGRNAIARLDPDLAVELSRLEDDLDLPHVRENFDRLFRSTSDGLRRIRDIVANLRDFAQIDQAEFSEIDLNAALQTTLEALRHEIAQKPVEVHTDFTELPRVACYPGKINQVFLQVLTNAIQASQPGGPIHVRTRLLCAENAVLVEIEDHGEGIRPEHLPHLFEPFFTTKPIGSGTGLGLPICYGIVRDHGGSISAESHLGTGSLFRIRLPLHPPQPQDAHKPAPAG
jgi:signal transduction histidine kinase